MKIFKKIFKKYDALNESIKENIDGIRVVKSFVREDYEINKFDKSANELKKDFTKAERIIAINSPAMQIAVNLKADKLFFVIKSSILLSIPS